MYLCCYSVHLSSPPDVGSRRCALVQRPLPSPMQDYTSNVLGVLLDYSVYSVSNTAPLHIVGTFELESSVLDIFPDLGLRVFILPAAEFNRTFQSGVKDSRDC